MAVEWVLGRCDPALLDLYGDQEQTDDYVADTDCSRMIDQRRMQKVLICQMSVLDSMISVLEGLECPRKLLTEPRPSNPDNKARARWKSVKAEVKAQVEEMESLISTLQAKVEQIYTKRQTLKQLVQEIEKKKEMSEQLEQRLQKAQRALRACEGQLSDLRVESETLLGYVDNWQVLKDELQGYVTATQEMLLYKIVSVSQSELCLELGPCQSDSYSNSPKLEPLKLSVTWSHDDRFRLQMRGGRAGIMEECFDGRMSQLRATLVEVTERFTSQKDMLAEIQALHDSFAIDWRPAERQLMFLKSASVICILDVEMGYPTAGQATLLSVRKDAQFIDTALLKPPKDNLSLTQWLVFLSSCTLI